MTYKEAREYLVPIAANCVLPQYAAALEKAMEALDLVERLEKEKAALLEDVKKMACADSACEVCAKAMTAAGCEESDYDCRKCNKEGCKCKNCDGLGRWEWRGVQGDA